MSFEWLSVFGVLAIGGSAVIWDVKCRRIPNWLTLSGLIYGIGLTLLLNRGNWFQPFYGMALGLIVFFPFYALGGLGAGDVKLMAAIGAIWGPQQLLRVILFTALAGGLISLMKMIIEYGVHYTVLRLYMFVTSFWNKSQRATVFESNQRKHLYIPYGVAIFAGIVFAIFFRR